MGIESSWMFDLFGTVFPVVFVLLIGIVLLSMGKEVRRWGRNNSEPLLTVPSRITSRRMKMSQSQTEPGSTARTLYYVTFEVESGDRLEFKVNGEEYVCALREMKDGSHSKERVMSASSDIIVYIPNAYAVKPSSLRQDGVSFF
ncbi:unknown protein [Paenibacillus amylolyticus]|uniref:DUF2500 domain-containing protein n=1 Tax=Paenibacillus amylolyticus TaxID=1451 RepID=A0A100VLV7_PAEAM|nr:unknown protein [Paenibacillus amylolyticus]